ncbi:MAG: hypothetical protein ABIJ97_12725 [Bacteroidota bacterium]
MTQKKYRLLPRFVNLLIILVIILTMNNVKYWKRDNRVISNDVISYYAYLPALFIHNDLKFDFLEQNKELYSSQLWPLTTSDGKKVIKMSMGLAILYTPFFLIAHAYANIFDYPADGFSEPYRFMLLLSSIFYLCIGLRFLRKLMQQYFDNMVVSFTLLLLFGCTNLFYYATFESTVSHIYSFSLIVVFIYYLIIWLNKITFKITIFLGLLIGIISLIRPTNISVAIFFILIGITSFTHFKERIFLLGKNYKHILLIILLAFLIWLPQLIYWKYTTGHFLYYSYGDDEKFFFNDPQIINGLFSYRKGWFLYTPLMFFIVLGMIISFKRFKEFALSNVIFFIAIVYITFSWWCWWYGGGYSARPMADFYGIFALSLAVLIDWISKRKLVIKTVLVTLLALLFVHGIFQSAQYHYDVIHWDSMSNKAYWDRFGKMSFPDNYDELLEYPDYEKTKTGEQAIIPLDKVPLDNRLRK